MEENETKTGFYASIIHGRMLFPFSFNEKLSENRTSKIMS